MELSQAWVVLGIFLAGNFMSAVGFFFALRQRIAVLEARLENLKVGIDELRKIVLHRHRSIGDSGGD